MDVLTGSGEVTPKTMRGLSARRESKCLSRYEGEIRDAADHGERSALLCYADCGAEQLSAVRELERRGFEIRVRRETSGGVLQCPGYYAEW